jgi:hypothetical protein
MDPEIRYAKSGDVHIAYQVFGDGSVDLVYIPGFISNIENYWEWPEFARWLRHIGTRARVILFDKRGTGLSDRLGQLPNLDQRMDDARAVMDAAGSRRAAVMGISEGGSLANYSPVHTRIVVRRSSSVVHLRASQIGSRQNRNPTPLSTMSTRPGVAARVSNLSRRPRRAASNFSAGGADGKGRAAARRRSRA